MGGTTQTAMARFDEGKGIEAAMTLRGPRSHGR
jgi:hypothetical protein